MGKKIKKVAMTGGSGGVGLALIKKLLSENVEILLFMRKESTRFHRLPQDDRLHIEYYALNELNQFIPNEKDYDVFFHLGWVNSIRTKRDDIAAQTVNITYACYAADLAYQLGCHAFIGVGSQAEYGRKNEPLRPDMLCEPETAYGVMKLSACYTTRILCNRYNMRHNWVRVLSGYGIYDNEDSLLISSIINSLQGKPLNFSKGEQIWDFVFMDDIAEALFLTAERGHENAIYVVGSGEARPLKEYIKILCDRLGEKMEPGMGKIAYSKNQVMHLEADISKITDDIGWKPKISFEEGIERVIEFYKNWNGK